MTSYHRKPEINIKKNAIPIIYLDTCIMIELSRYEEGICKSKYEKEIGELYNVLTVLMSEKKILCPLGDQMREMGNSVKREKARNFLYQFTNVEFREPYILEKEELNSGYQAFLNEELSIDFNCDFVFKEDRYLNSQFKINVTSIYKKNKLDKLKEEKKSTVTILNDAKSCKRVAPNLEQQLDAELKSDFTVFRYRLERAFDSIESLSLFFDTIIEVLKRNKCEPNIFNPECKSAVAMHNHFLLSSYHHNLPYVWIQSVLWAHRMQRPNKVVDGDNIDTIWASAYLPFVNYVVTDNDFCGLLHGTGLSEQYNTKVYSLKTISDILVILKNLL